ncbi:MAG TPA: NAD(P)H-dependent oxidoreductase [Caulobacteraceae bacterium]
MLGSARSDGNTAAAVRRLAAALPDHQLLDLSALRIAAFDYAAPARADDFTIIVDAMLAHRAIVFATPVYWYAMSGPMKILFDRLTDLLLTPEGRTRGRALAGRGVWVLATGTDPEAPACFIEPFRLTAAYFDMIYGGDCYVRCAEDTLPDDVDMARVDAFAGRVAAA